MKLKIIYSSIMLLIITNILTSCCDNGKTSKSSVEIILENIANRKSVRDYIEGKQIESEKIEKLLRAGMAAPTGKNTQPWEFIVISERTILDSLAANLPYAKMLQQATLAIIVCADTSKSEYWYVDCAAATENILLAAEAMELGAVWTASYPYENRMSAVKKVTQHPDNIQSLCVIPIGYPSMKESPKDKWKPEKIHKEKW
ncbi:MAG: nitroreductase family protein [Prevotellaceae bacterium]|jgi:nitroreductase|nr:nitroreductase family protein [Prevotellaceae bacterium]